MTDKFQINARYQFKSFEKGLITFSLALIGVVGFAFFGVFDLRDVTTCASFVLTCAFFSFPAIYLHITYLIENWGTILNVDKRQNSFTITFQNEVFNYKFQDIENTELNLGIYYKNQIDNGSRKPAPWTNYGYLKLRMKDGRVFRFTSLMIDLEKLTLPVTITKFRLHPFLKR